jgi:hypothetical protein
LATVSAIVPDPSGADAALRSDLGLPAKPDGAWNSLAAGRRTAQTLTQSTLRQ